MLPYLKEPHKKAQKLLFCLSTAESLTSFSRFLPSFYQEQGCELYYVDQAEDLVCSAPRVQFESDASQAGGVKKGPCGSLHEFLTTDKGLKEHKEQKKRKVLVISFANFDTKDLIKHNSIMDDERKVDGTKIPEDVLVIGIYNPYSPNAYHGADFTSCFNEVIDFEFDIPDVPFVEELKVDVQECSSLLLPLPSSLSSYEIELYNSSNWESLLLGNWELKGNSLSFREGALLTALNQGKAFGFSGIVYVPVSDKQVKVY